MAEPMSFQPDSRVLNAFISWIEQPQFAPHHARQWGLRYRDNPEAAMCEATFWAVLHDCGVTVEPNPDVTPDFVCRKGATKFYVEVTCICVDTATRKTGLEPFFSGARSYRSLNDAIRGECINKVNKVANLDAPCVVAVGTFHFAASAVAVSRGLIEWLHTDPCIAFDFDPHAGQLLGEPYQLARWHKSLFRQSSGVAGVTSP